MLKKIRFILGALILVAAYSFLIRHIKGFNTDNLLEWVLPYIGTGIVMLLSAWFAGVNFGKPTFQGSFLVKILGLVFLLALLPILVTIQVIKFVFQGGIGYVFSGGSSHTPKKKTSKQPVVKSDNRKKYSSRDFEIDVEDLCKKCAHNGRSALYSNAHSWLQQNHKVNRITINPEINWPASASGQGEIVLHIVYDITLFNEDGQGECALYKQEPDALLRKLRTLITALRSKYQGLDCSWEFGYTVKF